jgi:hypothetical protein
LGSNWITTIETGDFIGLNSLTELYDYVYENGLFYIEIRVVKGLWAATGFRRLKRVISLGWEN